MMTEKQKKIFVAIGIAGVLWIAIIIGVVAHIVLAGDGFTREDLKNLRKQVEKQAEGVEECVPDCLMQQSEIEEKLDMSNKGKCFDECEVNMRAGTEVCYERVCRYDKKIGRKMYGITVHYDLAGEVSGAESMDWEEIDD
jgi:hypothetical protein